MSRFPSHWVHSRVKIGFKLPDLDIQVKAADLPEVKMEYLFHPDRRWRIDYCWPEPEFMLAVEIEGGAWTRGRHVRGQGFMGDIEKYNALTFSGYSLLRFTPEQVFDGTAIREIQKWFDKRRKK